MPHATILNHVTSLAFKALYAEDIVLPAQYRAKFQELLLQEGLVSDYTEEDLIQDAAKSTLEYAQNIMDKTHGALGDLNGYIHIAQEAIASRDVVSLSGVLNLIHTMQSEIHQLRSEVYLDGLTRIYNRKWIFDKLLDRQSAFSFRGTMAFIDVNEFKMLNDTFGHDLGDRILTYLGKYLKEAIIHRLPPESLHVIRYAGDEFALIGTVSEDSLKKLLYFVQSSVMQKKFKAQDSVFKIAFSFGVTSFECGEDFLDVLKRADTAMYENKKLLKENKDYE